MKTNFIKIIVPAFASLLSSCGGEEAAAPENKKPESAVEADKINKTNLLAVSDPGPVDLAQLGKRAFTVCAICHGVAPDAPPRQGPNLYGVYGAPAARLPNYSYSNAFRSTDIIWNDENLDAYIEKPQNLIPGNIMAFAGVKDLEKRRAIIAYLKSLTDKQTAEDENPR